MFYLSENVAQLLPSLRIINTVTTRYHLETDENFDQLSVSGKRSGVFAVECTPPLRGIDMLCTRRDLFADRCRVLCINIYPLRAGIHETEGIHRDGMAPSTHVRRILVSGLRLRVRRGGGAVRTASGLDKFPELLAGGKALEEIRPGVHDRPHQPQSLHQHKNLGERRLPVILAGSYQPPDSRGRKRLCMANSHADPRDAVYSRIRDTRRRSFSVRECVSFRCSG